MDVWVSGCFLGLFLLILVIVFLVQVSTKNNRSKSSVVPGRKITWGRDRATGYRMKIVTDPDGTKHIYLFPRGSRPPESDYHSHEVVKPDGKVVYHRRADGKVIVNNRRPRQN